MISLGNDAYEWIKQTDNNKGCYNMKKPLSQFWKSHLSMTMQEIVNDSDNSLQEGTEQDSPDKERQDRLDFYFIRDADFAGK